MSENKYSINHITIDKIKKELIAEFLTDFETVVEYFKLDGHLVGALREKWEKRPK